jgi:hypothetical protein
MTADGIEQDIPAERRQGPDTRRVRRVPQASPRCRKSARRSRSSHPQRLPPLWREDSRRAAKRDPGGDIGAPRPERLRVPRDSDVQLAYEEPAKRRAQWSGFPSLCYMTGVLAHSAPMRLASILLGSKTSPRGLRSAWPRCRTRSATTLLVIRDKSLGRSKCRG